MPRPWTAGGLVVVCAALTGCLGRGTDTRTVAWWDRLGGVGPGGGLHIQTTVIDQPAGDPYLNHGLWAAAGRPVPHELSALLARNGVRVGLLTGQLPGEFDRLVHSEHATLDPTYRTMHPGKPKVVPVNGPIDRCGYQVVHDLAADPQRVDLTGAECGVAVTATPTDGGRVRLVCELQVQHGDRQPFLKPTADGTFARSDHKPLEAYPTLAWEVTVGPDDYLIVGAVESAGTLGQAFFVPTDGGRDRQRVLVVRAGQGAPKPTGRARTTPAGAAQVTARGRK